MHDRSNYMSQKHRSPYSAFKHRLEEKLEEHFPKDKCQERGAGLMLFAEACVLFNETLKEYGNEDGKTDHSGGVEGEVQRPQVEDK